jgi:hypothetical protein
MANDGRSVATDRESSEAEHPFRGLTDGWRVVGRGQRSPGVRVRTRLELSLDPEQSDWLNVASERAGLTAEAFVKTLLDAARAAEAHPPAQATAAQAG